MPKAVLVITGDGGECYEALYAVHRLREAGHEPRRVAHELAAELTITAAWLGLDGIEVAPRGDLAPQLAAAID